MRARGQTRGRALAGPAHGPVRGGDRRISIPNSAFYRPGGLPLKRSQALQALIDVTLMFFVFLFALATGVSIAAALFLLFCVRC